MLINFSVENFRSFRAEQTLNLVASGRFKDHQDHCLPIANTGKDVLCVSVVYGANAAGKSNLVRAIDFAQDVILFGSRPFKSLALNQFRFLQGNSPSSFEFRFLVGDQIFVYGFAINPEAVVQEWLEATTNKGKEVEIFSRKGQDISIGKLKSFGEDGTTSAGALAALKQLGARPDQLLLNKVVDLDPSHRGRLLDRAAEWFTDSLTVIQPEASFGSLLELVDDDVTFRRFAADFLRNAGTGVHELHIEQSKINADKLPKGILAGLQMATEQEARSAIGGPGMSLQFDPSDQTTVIRRNLAARHQVQDRAYSIPFADESDGTQRCLNLLPALFHSLDRDHPRVYVIDELDRSLHPLLSHSLLKFFLETCPGSVRQMIVTTHETHLLDQNLLRRDEIWFAEKDEQQQTRLYSLADMNVRSDVRIEKGYLHGRFGGIPFIGDTKPLMDIVACPAES